LALLLLMSLLVFGCASDKRESAPGEPTLFRVEVNGNWGYIHKNGKVAITPQFDWTEDFSEGLAIVSIGREGSYIDMTGKYVITHCPTRLVASPRVSRV
jgi:hypothetical protein